MISTTTTENNQSVSNFLDILGPYALLPQITYPTRVTNNSKTIIDNIFLDSSNLETYSGNITWNISDHLPPQFLLIKNIYPNKIKNNIHQRNWKKFNNNEFVLDYLEVNWDSTLQLEQENIDLSFDIFYDKMNDIIDKRAPLEKLTNNK